METVQVRTRSARALGAVMVALAVGAVASAGTAGAGTLLASVPSAALFATIGWAAFWRPHVEVSDGAVVVVNTLRTVVVPWPTIEAVEGRYGLRLQTVFGPVTAWAAGAPAGRQRARDQESPAAHAVSTRLEVLRSAGHLEHARLERDALDVRWHRRLVAVLVALTVASVAVALAP